jgi:hypothetical protein
MLLYAGSFILPSYVTSGAGSGPGHDKEIVTVCCSGMGTFQMITSFWTAVDLRNRAVQFTLFSTSGMSPNKILHTFRS